MKETSKAMRRRMADTSFPWDKVFHGIGIDVGASDDPWPNAVPFNIPDGGGDRLTAFFSPQFRVDYVHASQVLEHALNPVVMLSSWLEMLKPGGHIVATVPDFALYEHCIFPSKWNAGHKSTWSLDISSLIPPQILAPVKGHIHCKLPEWLEQFPVKVLRCALVDTNFNYSFGPEVDQTFLFEDGVEAFCEFVLKKL